MSDAKSVKRVDLSHVARAVPKSPAFALLGSATALCVLLLGLSVAACRRVPPSIRTFCEKECSCGCDLEECVKRETALFNTLRTSEECSERVDDYIECMIRLGGCEVKLDGKNHFVNYLCTEQAFKAFDCGHNPHPVFRE